MCLRQGSPSSDSYLLGGPKRPPRGGKGTPRTATPFHAISTLPTSIPRPCRLSIIKESVVPVKVTTGRDCGLLGPAVPQPPEQCLAHGSWQMPCPASPAVQEAPWSLWASGLRPCSEQTLVLPTTNQGPRRASQTGDGAGPTGGEPLSHRAESLSPALGVLWDSRLSAAHTHAHAKPAVCLACPEGVGFSRAGRGVKSVLVTIQHVAGGGPTRGGREKGQGQDTDNSPSDHLDVQPMKLLKL